MPAVESDQVSMEKTDPTQITHLPLGFSTRCLHLLTPFDLMKRLDDPVPNSAFRGTLRWLKWKITRPFKSEEPQTINDYETIRLLPYEFQ